MLNHPRPSNAVSRALMGWWDRDGVGGLPAIELDETVGTRCGQVADVDETFNAAEADRGLETLFGGCRVLDQDLLGDVWGRNSWPAAVM